MRYLTIVLLVLAACATAPQAPSSQTGEPPAPAQTRPHSPGVVSIASRGLTCNSAIPLEAAGEGEGLKRENAWIAENYPGSKKVKQALLLCNGKHADQIDILTADGQQRSIYFDISTWFGKP
jgi:hypothetical protein